MELDAKLWRGDLHAVVSMVQSQALTGLSRTMPQTRAEIVVDSRLLLRTSTLLEGWAVMLARWALEASATGLAQAGPASDFLAVCAKSLDPPPAALLRRARRDGVVRRAHLARAIGQCLRHHRCGRPWRPRASTTAPSTPAAVDRTHFAAHSVPARRRRFARAGRVDGAAHAERAHAAARCVRARRGRRRRARGGGRATPLT